MEQTKAFSPLLFVLPVVLLIISLLGFLVSNRQPKANVVESEYPPDTFREITAEEVQDVEPEEQTFSDGRIVVDPDLEMDLEEMEHSAFWKSLSESRKKYARKVFNLLTQYCIINNIYVLSFESDMEEYRDSNGYYVLFTNGSKYVRVYNDYFLLEGSDEQL